MENYELYHAGIKGMRWGIRRFQRKDGSLTPAGRKRYGQNSTDKTQAKIDSINKKTAEQLKKIKAEGKAASRIAKAEEASAAKIAKAQAKYQPKAKADTPKPKSLSEMSDDEIRSKINRIRLEKELASLTPSEVSGGKKFMTSVLNDVVAPAAKSAGKKLLTDFLEDRIGSTLGLDKKGGDGDDWIKKLAKENERMNTIKKNEELNDYFNKKKNKGSDADDGGKKTKDKSKPKNSDDEGSSKTKEAKDSNTKGDSDAETVDRKTAKQMRKEVEREVKEELEREREFNELIRNSEKEAKKWIDAEFTEIDANDVIDTEEFNRGEKYTIRFLEGD